MHPAYLSDEELLRACEVRTMRGSGPGGQHRNKTDTAVEIVHASGVVGQASESRSQLTNRTNALFRLRLNLATQLRGTSLISRDADPVPPAAWSKWIRGGRVSIKQAHRDYPALLAFALDILLRHEFELQIAADELQIASSQILKLIRWYPPALDWCNEQRRQFGLHPLR